MSVKPYSLAKSPAVSIGLVFASKSKPRSNATTVRPMDPGDSVPPRSKSFQTSVRMAGPPRLISEAIRHE